LRQGAGRFTRIVFTQRLLWDQRRTADREGTELLDHEAVKETKFAKHEEHEDFRHSGHSSCLRVL
jgi:hypothetical protein